MGSPGRTKRDRPLEVMKVEQACAMHPSGWWIRDNPQFDDAAKQRRQIAYRHKRSNCAWQKPSNTARVSKALSMGDRCVKDFTKVSFKRKASHTTNLDDSRPQTPSGRA